VLSAHSTSALAPGADQLRVARSYPVEQADRETQRRSIEVMSTPFADVFSDPWRES
jgi:hypothetical protein